MIKHMMTEKKNKNKWFRIKRERDTVELILWQIYDHVSTIFCCFLDVFQIIHPFSLCSVCSSGYRAAEWTFRFLNVDESGAGSAACLPAWMMLHDKGSRSPSAAALFTGWYWCFFFISYCRQQSSINNRGQMCVSLWSEALGPELQPAGRSVRLQLSRRSVNTATTQQSDSSRWSLCAAELAVARTSFVMLRG